MEIVKIQMSDNILEFNVLGEDHTFLNVLRDELKNIPDVVASAYHITIHTSPVVYVKTEGSLKPASAVLKAGKNIITSCDQLLAQIKPL